MKLTTLEWENINKHSINYTKRSTAYIQYREVLPGVWEDNGQLRIYPYTLHFGVN